MTKPDYTTAAANDPTMDMEQAAGFLHLGYDAMKELVRTGAVPAVQLNKKHTVLLRDDLIAYVRDEGRRQADERRRSKQRRAAVDPVSTKPRRVAAHKPDLSRYES